MSLFLLLIDQLRVLQYASKFLKARFHGEKVVLL